MEAGLLAEDDSGDENEDHTIRCRFPIVDVNALPIDKRNILAEHEDEILTQVYHTKNKSSSLSDSFMIHTKETNPVQQLLVNSFPLP